MAGGSPVERRLSQRVLLPLPLGNALFKLIGFLGQTIGHVQNHLVGVVHIHNAPDH